jgi:hypothetical protein
LQQILNDNKAQHVFKHETGEISKVQIEYAGMGIRTIRIANLPPEVSERAIHSILSRYGEVKEIRAEKWSRNYRYKIDNGICIVTMNLREHIPSYLNTTNNKVLLSYEGQPATCYGCNSTTHQFIECPTRRNRVQRPESTAPPTWSAVVQQLHTTCNTIEGTSGHNNEQ